MLQQKRFYRELYKQCDLVNFTVCIEETDLQIALPEQYHNKEVLLKIQELIKRIRKEMKKYIKIRPEFLTTLEPYPYTTNAPNFVKEMCAASFLAGVGPMAAVAGYFAEKVGKMLAEFSPEIIIENGGDIWLKSEQTRRVAIYAGSSPFSCRLGLEIAPYKTPLGICTSSGTVGHSLSFGNADAVVVVASSAILADAVATAAGNMVQCENTLAEAVEFACQIPGVSGSIAIKSDKMAVLGDITLCRF